MNKKIFFIIFILIIISVLIFFIFFNNKRAKKYKIGNNSSSQEIVDYILNISSYEATINVEVNSNKNSNNYIIKQKYEKSGTNIQEVLEPNNINGVKIIKEEDNLKIENTNLNLNMIFERYNYLSDNVLDLNSFIENYKSNNNESKFEEKDNQIIMKTIDNSNNKNIKYKTLYIDKNMGNPIKMEIKDTNQNSSIYIIYTEVKVNSLN